MSGQVDLAALRALEAAATPGPWRTGRTDGVVRHYVEPESIARALAGLVDWVTGDDAAFIAGARNALVPLLDEIESLRARVAAVEALARDWQWYVPAAAFRAALEAKL